MHLLAHVWKRELGSFNVTYSVSAQVAGDGWRSADTRLPEKVWGSCTGSGIPQYLPRQYQHVDAHCALGICTAGQKSIVTISTTVILMLFYVGTIIIIAWHSRQTTGHHTGSHRVMLYHVGTIILKLWHTRQVQKCLKAIGVPPIPGSLAKILPGRYPVVRYRVLRKTSVRTRARPFSVKSFSRW